METLETIPAVRAAMATARADGRRVALVPTMGFLHPGHIALVERARAVCDVVVASIFVNPTQFAPGEDLATYPRDADGDRRKLEAAGCDFLFQPDSNEVYPDGFSTFVSVEGVSRLFEGAIRPTHFRGVATVVAKLFNIVRPDVAVFGQKDAQQVAVIRRMIDDLDFGIALEIVETVREPDGLARSSRNVYLAPDDRLRAVALSKSLEAARGAIEDGGSLDEARARMRSTLEPSVDAIDYAEIVEAASFEPARDGVADGLLAIVAARVGGTRLIDNAPMPATARH
ncbi:MAG TPA: pantoate--beta-alanine ligase [Candidatus Kapabacteria bacterium]|jgi:pantoate--beta-alanine ligase|nr:pantoate--beta-alanine ligase [Candidatus Kapabacteria bacterium]